MANGKDTTADEAKRWALLAVVFVTGGVCALPFGVSLYHLLDFCGGWLTLGAYAIALRAAIALMFSGIVLCVLLLFYRLRNDETSPSLSSGLVVIAIGAVAMVAVLFAARGQLLR